MFYRVWSLEKKKEKLLLKVMDYLATLRSSKHDEGQDLMNTKNWTEK